MTVNGVADQLRPPAVPLIAHDPYLSVWCPANALTDADTVHWTRGLQAVRGQVKIDGKLYRFLGTGSGEPMSQSGLEVLPTRTIASFDAAGIRLVVTFMTPALPSDLDVLARPLTYIVCEARSTDGRNHKVEMSVQASALIAGDAGTQIIHRAIAGTGFSGIQAGSKSQPVLAHRGDGVRINWGTLNLATKPDQILDAQVRSRLGGRSAIPVAAEDAWLSLDLKPLDVGSQPQARWCMIAYDDDYSIQYFKRNLRPYWRRNGDDTADLLRKGASDFAKLRTRCEKFDAELMSDLRTAGGDKYARLCALAYRQCLAGNKLAADTTGQPLLFPKENTSNGCIATVDVIFPMAPQFFLFGPSLSRAMMAPVLEYSRSSRWKFPFAPHDLGTYPQANGQVYGGGERTEENQMPVEESANMLILMAAICQMEGNASFTDKYWPVLTKWAEYLREKGFDPENQLCTDDFLGHLAHNVNLSAKALIGLACYAKMAEMRGEQARAKEYRDLARSFAERWVKEAADGDHYRLTFDKAGTWSQKYNLVWDRILGLNLFPDSVRNQEMAHYRKSIKPFGLPLDSRGPGAKLDWSLWTATLTQNPDDFAAIMEPVYRFANETPQRVGLGDWYDTSNGNHLFMHSRPVVGGVFLQMLYSEAVWKKWAGRDKFKATGWSRVPDPPVVTSVVAAADKQAAEWRYTLAEPAKGWSDRRFDDSTWSRGRSGFGTAGTPGVFIGTEWSKPDIWLRREVQLTSNQIGNLALWMHHDEDAEVYINGVLAAKTTGWTSQYEVFPISSAAREALVVGANSIAVHCRQTSGGQYIDVGLVTVKEGQ